MPQWTDEQTQVIESRGQDLLVSAAAGSGKTAVLVQRIMEKILDVDQPADIDRIPASVLNGFIAELPAVKRVIFNMACVEDLPHREIAEKLGITEGASRSMLTKAKKTLAGMINAYMDKNK